MGRPKGSTNKPKDPNAPPRAGREKRTADSAPPRNPGMGDNSGDLTDDQIRKLHLQHTNKYERALEFKKKADADFKNACKAAQADLGKHAVDDIKHAISIRTPEGQLAFKERLAREAKVAAWYNMPIGHIDDLFTADRTPSVEKAFNEGKNVGMEGGPASPPQQMGMEQAQAWMNGYHAGQAVNLEKVGKLDPSSAKAAAGDTGPATGADIEEDEDLPPLQSTAGDMSDPLHDTTH